MNTISHQYQTPNLCTLSSTGVFGGVCSGIANSLSVSTGIVRLGFVLSIFFSFGTTLLVYLALYFSFPYQNEARENRFLGVCRRLSDRLNIEIGLVRLVVLFLFVSSLGLVSLAYLFGHLVLSEQN